MYENEKNMQYWTQATPRYITIFTVSEYKIELFGNIKIYKPHCGAQMTSNGKM